MDTFPNKKTGMRDHLTESSMLAMLREGIDISPARLEVVLEPAAEADAVVRVTWREKAATFAVEAKAGSTPAALQRALEQAREFASGFGILPMVYLPYLDNEALARLEDLQVSGIDTAGNALILAEDFCLYRTGRAKRFRDSRPIRNPYAGDSSIVARCFWLRPRFGSLSELREFALQNTILAQGSDQTSFLALGTVSKALNALREELIVVNDGSGMRLADAARLAMRLQQGYRERPGRRLTGKTALSREEVWERLAADCAASGNRYVSTGVSASAYYGVLAGMDRLALYVDSVSRVAEVLQVREGAAFADIELVEARSSVPFFDCRHEGSAVWASDIQCWLELAQGSSREMEAAEALKASMLQRREQGRP